MTESVVIVGGRSAAVRAARSLGFRTIVLSTPPVHPTVQKYADEAIAADFFDRSSLLSLVARWRLRPPVAAVAATEESVLPAAWLRAALRLPGLRPVEAERFRDKRLMKHWFRRNGIPCARSRRVRSSTRVSALVDALGLPLVIKPPASSGSRGTTIVRSAEQAALALHSLAVPALAESFVSGREASVETLVEDGKPIWTNITSYELPGVESLVPAPDLSREDELLALNEQVVAAMGLPHGMTHFEGFCTQDGWVAGEIAARPPGGHLMPLIHLAYGFDPWEAVVRLHLGQSVRPPPSATRFAAAHLLVAPEGVVRSIDGLDEARAIPGVTEVHSTLKPGDRVQRRVSVSITVGRVVVCTDAAVSVRAILKEAVGRVHIDVLPVAGGLDSAQAEP